LPKETVHFVKWLAKSEVNLTGQFVCQSLSLFICLDSGNKKVP